VTLELAREEPPASRSCRLCGRPVEGHICTSCGVDLDTGDLVAEPAPPAPPELDGARPLRREALAASAAEEIPRTSRELLRRGVIELSHGVPGTLACLLFVAFALSFREVPWVGDKVPWSGQLGATFVLAFLLVERARAAHEGRGGLMGSSGAFDPSALGSSLFSAALLLPVLAGMTASGPVVGLAAGVPFAFLFPAVLGALVCDGWQEMTPLRLKDAVVRSPGYLLTTFWVAVSLVLGLVPVWLLDGSGAWRAPIAVLGIGLAGALAGLMRHDAETIPAS
jgi:hypothetical protein